MNNILGHNFGTVYRFEVVRALKKKSFWLSIIALPLIFVVIFGISLLSGDQADKATDKLAQEKFSWEITDDSGLVRHDLAEQLGAKLTTDKTVAIERVKSGQLDAYVYYPSELNKSKVEVYAKESGIFGNDKYQKVASNLLQTSVLSKADPREASVLGGSVAYDTHTYLNGKPHNAIMDMIAPGVFLVLFYLIIAMFSSQMLNATVEEKENRITEMILTTIKARTLIIGKVIAFMTLIMIQVLLLLGLMIVFYLIAKQYLTLPNFDLSSITFDPARIAISAVLFVGSILLFSGILVAIGASAPTAKEASQFLSVPMILIFGPLYVLPMLLTTPDALAVKVVSLIPFTAPIPLMTRNAVGNLPIAEALLGIVIIYVTALVVFTIAGKLFQTGIVDYDRKLSIKGLFKKKA